MSARAEELSGADLERDVAFFDTAGQAQGLTRRWAMEDMRAPAPYRLYRATVSQHWSSIGQQTRRPRRGDAVGRYEPQ